jgi:hypothetical protein
VSAIFRAHRDAGGRCPPAASPAGRVFHAVATCRTAEAGGHLERCADCGAERPVYNSCRNRHCPGCQSYAQKVWLDARIDRVLPVPHFHVVFTLPSELRPLALANRRAGYDILFRAASETLLTLGRQRLRATLGITAVLHTWTRSLDYHPHLHCIVTGGGLALSGRRWMPARQDWLFPVAVMRALFRGKVLAFLRERAHELRRFDPSVVRTLRRRDWVVYAKRPFGGAEAIFAYLGRYTHRVGISNQRLVSMSSGQVTFRTRGDRRTRLSVGEFVRRFLRHVLPPGFRKIRHYGLLAPACVRSRLAVAERLLRKPARAPLAPVDSSLPSPQHCGACGSDRLVRTELRWARAPPSAEAADAA